MGYLKIPNLYADQAILLFRECYALEKVHGTSAHITFSQENGTQYFAGGVSHESFLELFDRDKLDADLRALGHAKLTVFGEAYGGSCQKMSKVYGPALRFVTFDVQVGDLWLDVPDAENVVGKLGLPFVDCVRVPADLDSLNAQRDRPSVIAMRNGCGDSQIREGVVLRPLHEFLKKNGARIIAKHKHPLFSETKTPREVDPAKAAAMHDAQQIADEWVTDMRLTHVLDKLLGAESPDVKRTPDVIAAMLADVKAEAGEEIAWSRDAERAISSRAAKLFKAIATKVQA